MGHHLTAFLGRPEHLRALGPSIPGLRLLGLPQGFALAPMPDALIDAHGDGGDEEAATATVKLTHALSVIAAAASIAGPIGWIESDWFGGNGSTTSALWRGGARIAGERCRDMLIALGVVRALREPNPGLLERIGHWIGDAPPSRFDEWDSIELGAHRRTVAAWERAERIGPALPTPAQEAEFAEVHRRLGSLALHPPRQFPTYRDWELAGLGVAAMFETAVLTLGNGGIEAVCFTSRSGTGLSGRFVTSFDERAAGGSREVRLEAADRALLRALGWQRCEGWWEGAWREADRATSALRALTEIGATVLSAAEVPGGEQVWWGPFVQSVLLADRIVGLEKSGDPRLVEVELDGERSTWPVHPGSCEERLLEWWMDSAPRLRPLASSRE